MADSGTIYINDEPAHIPTEEELMEFAETQGWTLEEYLSAIDKGLYSLKEKDEYIKSNRKRSKTS